MRLLPHLGYSRCWRRLLARNCLDDSLDIVNKRSSWWNRSCHSIDPAMALDGGGPADVDLSISLDPLLLEVSGGFYLV